MADHIEQAVRRSTSELELAGLEVAPSTSVKPLRIAKSPEAFECRLLTSMSFNSNQAILFGEVMTAFVSEHLVLDAARGIVGVDRSDEIVLHLRQSRRASRNGKRQNLAHGNGTVIDAAQRRKATSM